MALFRSQLRHLLYLLALGYGFTIWLIGKSTTKLPVTSSSSLTRYHISSRLRVQPQDPDESLMNYVRNMPLKERFQVERRNHVYNLKLGQRDEYNSAKCGSWPMQYLSTRQAKSPPQQQQSPPGKFPTGQDHRYLVYSCGQNVQDKDGCGGLSERLMTATGLFVVCLLTHREFFIDWPAHPLDSGLRMPFVNLQQTHSTTTSVQNKTLPISLSNWEPADLDVAFNIRSSSTYLDATRIRSTTEIKQSVRETQDHLTSTSQLRVQMNQGLVQRFLTDPSYSDRLESMGLTQDNAYECILSFLFRPTLEIQELIHQYRAVFRTPGVTTIAVHFPSAEPDSNRPLTLGDFTRSMPCAQELSRAIRMKTKNMDERFLYVIFADSDQTKKRVQEEFGHKLDLIFPPRLASRASSNFQRLEKSAPSTKEQKQQPGNEEREGKEEEELNVLSSYLLSETDYQIVTSFSSFGKLALFRKGAAGRRSAVLMPSKGELERAQASRGGGSSQSSAGTGIRLPDCTRLEDAIAPWELIASFDRLG